VFVSEGSESVKTATLSFKLNHCRALTTRALFGSESLSESLSESHYTRHCPSPYPRHYPSRCGSATEPDPPGIRDARPASAGCLHASPWKARAIQDSASKMHLDSASKSVTLPAHLAPRDSEVKVARGRGRHPRGVGLTAWSPERSGLAHYNSSTWQ
jgi:hypothetical protein